jgi:hypothetical protein
MDRENKHVGMKNISVFYANFKKFCVQFVAMHNALIDGHTIDNACVIAAANLSTFADLSCVRV